MLLKDIFDMSPEQAKAVKVTVVRVSFTCEWMLFIGSSAVTTANTREPRCFKSLAPIIAALDKGGISDFRVDIHMGKCGPIRWPSTQGLEALLHTYVALDNMKIGA